MRSGFGSLPRAGYSRAKRAAIVAASASVLTGTALAVPASSYASEIADPPAIANLDVTGETVEVPDPGVPLPDVEVDTDQPLLAPVTGALNLSATVDTAPEAADSAPTATEPGSAEPGSAEPTATEPGTAEAGAAEPVPAEPVPAEPVPAAPVAAAPVAAEPVAAEPVAAEPVAAEPVAAAPVAAEPVAAEPVAAEPVAAEPVAAAPVAAAPVATERPADVRSGAAQGVAAPAIAQPGLDVRTRFDAAQPSSGVSTPASAVATAPQPVTRPDGATPVVSEPIAREVLDLKAQRQTSPAMATATARDAAPRLSAEESVPAPTKDGLALAAPLTDLGPRGVDTVDLLSRNAPDASMGDWNLMPEVLFAIGPLFLAGAAVAAHGRRNARVAAGHVGVVQRGRHASTH